MSENDNSSYSFSFDGEIFPNGNTTKTDDELIDSYYQQDYLAYYSEKPEDAFYQKDKISYEDRLGMQLKYTYALDDYQYSSLIHYCFDTVLVENKNGYFTMQLKDNFKCFDQDVYQQLEQITVNIVADQVVANNADQTSQNVYTWNLSRDDVDKEIYLKAKVGNSISYSFVSILLFFIVCGVISFVTVCKFMNFQDQQKRRRKY